MLILGLDTSTKLCTVALYDSEEGYLGEINTKVAKNHSNILLPLIDQVLKNARRSIDDVERIALGMGPGSFTGIRVAMATAKGLAITKNIDIVGISTLDALAEPWKGKVFTLLDARKERVYYKVFEDGKALCEDSVGELRTLLEEYKGGKALFVGDGALAYAEVIREVYGEEAEIASEETALLRAIHFAKMAEKREASSLYHLEPLYVSKSQAKKTKERVKKRTIS